MLRLTRILATVSALAVLLIGADANGAVAPDAVPDAPASFSVRFDARPGPVVEAVSVSRLQPGERVVLTCRGCFGQTQVEAVAEGSRHVFRPKLRMNADSRLAVSVLGRNFGRVREYRVDDGRLRLDARRCTSLADDRRVRCRSLDDERPWATMNICTRTQVGVRAASPAGGRARERVAARFRLQYADGGRWVDVPNGESPWMVLGRAHRSWQGGYTFRFAGLSDRTFRGLVEFEWRRGSTVVRRAARFTSPRHGDGFSSAVCVL